MTHVLQSWEWGDFKARTTGWNPERCLFLDDQGAIRAAASILTRRLGPLRVMYVPKGPLVATNEPAVFDGVLNHLQELARRRHAIWLKIDPDIVTATGLPLANGGDDRHADRPDQEGQVILNLLKTSRPWHFSPDQVQFRNTLTLDLTQSEETLLARMNQTTRRKIRQSTNQGVVVREASTEADLRILYDLYLTTGERQGFLVRPWDYYRDLWQAFQNAKLAHIMIAEYESQALAGVVLFCFGKRVWYFYGMSGNDHRDRQPNYALQWAAIRWAKARGYTVYDWWGAPNTFTETDPMWGVYQFKVGFGSQVVRTIGAWDFVPYPALYWLYVQVMPRMIGWLRRRRDGIGMSHT